MSSIHQYSIVGLFIDLYILKSPPPPNNLSLISVIEINECIMRSAGGGFDVNSN